jgi:CoA:oxalate CoA-transferase
MNRKPLEGIKVLDFTRVLIGPYSTMMMSNLGAEIIKVERPEGGDDSRDFGPFVNGQSAYFVSINRGKKSIALDLKNKDAMIIIKDLIARVDVIVENFRPGTMEKLGLGYEECKAINNKVIYASLSGFGQTGPYSDLPAYDMIVQGMGGIMSITGYPDSPPVRVGTSIGDIVGGVFGTCGILSALYHREKTGKGQMIDVAMLDCQVAILENAIARYSATGKVPTPIGSMHPSITPFGAFKTRDSYIIIAAGNDNLWEKLCRLINNTDLFQDERFKTNGLRCQNQETLREIIEEGLSGKITKEWLEILKSGGIPCGPINAINQVFEDPQVIARNMLIDVEQPGIGKLKIAGNPIKMSLMEDTVSEEYAPQIGEHTEDILKGLLGYDDTLVENLVNSNAIKINKREEV